MEWTIGDWFCLDHDIVARAAEKGFEDKTGPDGRPVVLTTPSGPNATLFPRTRQDWSYEGHPHDPHDGTCGQQGCKINCPGQVLVTVPVRVDSSQLNDSTFSCAEPPGALAEFLHLSRPL